MKISLKQYNDTFKEESDYDLQSVYNILKTFNNRVQLERYYIDKNKSFNSDDYARLSIYEFLLIDIVCYIFKRKRTISDKTGKKILVNSSSLNNVIRIFDEIRPSLDIESLSRIVQLLKSYTTSDKHCIYSINDVNKLIEYRNLFYKLHQESLSTTGKDFKILEPIY